MPYSSASIERRGLTRASVVRIHLRQRRPSVDYPDKLFFHILIANPARREGSQVFYFESFLKQLNTYTIMKELIDILTSEDKSFDGLPAWVWLIAAPAALVLACMIGGTLS